MFQAVPPPNIRSSKLYTQHLFELLMMGRGTDLYIYSSHSNKYHCVTLHLVGYA